MISSYARRLWTCLEFHWRRLGANQTITFAELVPRLESGELGYRTVRDNVLQDVVMAEALTQHEPRAAEMFEREFMPVVRAVARRVGGPRAVDAVDNFGAELVLPRDERPPRMAQFQGRTPLAAWLRSVVTNYCLSQLRKRQEVTLDQVPERGCEEDPAARADRNPCERLLREVISPVVHGLAAEDRLLITMLVLDEVPQQQLAHSLGVHSGNVTRRRQRISTTIWQEIQTTAEKRGSRQQVTHCLELVLAGGDRDLQQSLGAALTNSFRGTAAEDTEVDRS